MTHAPDVIAEALRLARDGHSVAAVARAVGVPRRTVADWVAGRTPRAAPDDCRLIDGLPPTYVYLLGLYLGDGCLACHPREVYKLRVALDVRYPGIADECERAMTEVLPASRVGRRTTVDNCFEIYSYSKHWPALLPQHGAGKKHLRPIILTDWQRELVERSPNLLLRALIHSDGCRFINTGRNWSNPRYSFSNRSADILKIFCDACDLIGVAWTTAPHTVYVSRKTDVDRLDEFIGPKA